MPIRRLAFLGWKAAGAPTSWVTVSQFTVCCQDIYIVDSYFIRTSREHAGAAGVRAEIRALARGSKVILILLSWVTAQPHPPPQTNKAEPNPGRCQKAAPTAPLQAAPE